VFRLFQLERTKGCNASRTQALSKRLSFRSPPPLPILLQPVDLWSSRLQFAHSAPIELLHSVLRYPFCVIFHRSALSREGFEQQSVPMLAR
jgi:hypothetical protein